MKFGLFEKLKSGSFVTFSKASLRKPILQSCEYFLRKFYPPVLKTVFHLGVHTTGFYTGVLRTFHTLCSRNRIPHPVEPKRTGLHSSYPFHCSRVHTGLQLPLWAAMRRSIASLWVLNRLLKFRAMSAYIILFHLFQKSVNTHLIRVIYHNSESKSFYPGVKWLLLLFCP